MPLVTASEKGAGRTESFFERRVEMWLDIVSKSMSLTSLEREAWEGESPVNEVDMKLSYWVALPGLEVWIWQN